MTYKQLAYEFIQHMNNIMNINLGSIASISNDQTLMTLNGEEHIGSTNIYTRLAKMNFKNFFINPNYIQSQPTGTAREHIIVSGGGTIQIIEMLKYTQKNMTFTFLLMNYGGTYMISNIMLMIV